MVIIRPSVVILVAYDKLLMQLKTTMQGQKVTITLLVCVLTLPTQVANDLSRRRFSHRVSDKTNILEIACPQYCG